MSAPDRPRVDILLGTYNGAAFLREQVASLREQDFTGWRLLVRDDGSTDGTPAITAELAAADPRIVAVSDGLGNLGFGGNYRRLLQLSDATYTMYCDQDDVWLPNKVARCLERMAQVEAAHPGLPVVVHCDATVTDQHLHPVRDRFVGAAARGRTLASLLFQNCVQGAAMMMNAALRERALALEPDLPHDWHAALIAGFTGVRSFVDEPLMLYRQHGANVLGAAVADAGRSAAPDPVPLPWSVRNLRYAIPARPNLLRVFRHFADEARPDARRRWRRWDYLFGGGSTLRRLWYAATEPYALPAGRARRARLALAIVRGQL